MKISEFEGVVRFVPETDEESNIIKRNFPEEFLKSSKVVKVKSFVDRFGNSTEEKYVEIKSALSPKSEPPVGAI